MTHTISETSCAEPNGQTAVPGHLSSEGSSLMIIDVDALGDLGPPNEALVAKTAVAPMSKPKASCIGIRLTFLSGMSPYSSYPFMLHDKFPLPWNIHILSYQMWIQAIDCKKLPCYNQEACRLCQDLLLNNEGILQRIEMGAAQAVDLDQITLQCCTFMVSIGCASGHFLKMPWAVEPRFL